MLRQEEQLQISENSNLYKKIIKENHILRKIKENIDFSFVNPILKSSYCETFGRPAKEPERMFKLLFLKAMYDLSDEKLMEEAMCNMAYKYFLDLNPEDGVPESSLMTKFRKTRIQSEEILEEMLNETIKQAIEKGLIKSTAIIVDATHSQSKGRKETPTQILRRKSKELRKEIYKHNYEISNKFPEKPVETAGLSEEIEYTKQLIESINEYIKSQSNEKLRKKHEDLKTLVESEKIKEIQSALDQDAKIGHKSENNHFFGYKNHIAINDERLITGIEVTTGEAADGKILKRLVDKSKNNGIKVMEILGDRAYSSKENIEFAEAENIKLLSKLNPNISNSIIKKDDGFIYNKDADMYQCPAGQLSIRKAKEGKKNVRNNQQIKYYFDINKCKDCPMQDGCYKKGAKSKTYGITILSDEHKNQLKFENSDYFKERIKQRYKIEAKNAELKQAHGLDKSKYVGLFGMTIQTYTTAIVINCKRIVKMLSTNNRTIGV